jgi:hypothetical protein
MAINASRSMNDDLVEGATDGKYKKLRPNSSASSMNTEATYDTRKSLSLLYYGYGEARMNEVPGRNTYVRNPSFVPNKFETLEDSSVLGESW